MFSSYGYVFVLFGGVFVLFGGVFFLLLSFFRASARFFICFLFLERPSETGNSRSGYATRK